MSYGALLVFILLALFVALVIKKNRIFQEPTHGEILNALDIESYMSPEQIKASVEFSEQWDDYAFRRVLSELCESNEIEFIDTEADGKIEFLYRKR